MPVKRIGIGSNGLIQKTQLRDSRLGRTDDSGTQLIEGILIYNTKKRLAEDKLHRSRERFRHLANHDSLIGLFNTRYLYKALDRLIVESRAANEPFSLVFLDMDNFKPINDTYGHAGLGGAGGAGFDPTIFADFSDILGDFFGFGDLFGRRRGPRRGADLRYNLEISFEEVAFGTETQIKIPRAEPCAECSGSGAAPGTKPSTCPTCGGAGQVTFQQGFFTIARPRPVPRFRQRAPRSSSPGRLPRSARRGARAAGRGSAACRIHPPAR